MQRWVVRSVLALIFLYGVLLIPDCSTDTIHRSNNQAFEWKRDDYWKSLEQAFIRTRNASPDSVKSATDSMLAKGAQLLTSVEHDSVIAPGDTRLATFQQIFFQVSPLVAASHDASVYEALYTRARATIKQASRTWNMDDADSRKAVYMLLYGLRAAEEEVVLQLNTAINPVQSITPEPSATPLTTLEGIELHSGDLLVSRGGAEVSAFISRGNDFPGNFSHVALLYVDESTHTPSLIEAHIEKGVALASADVYMKDTKLRFMILRPRHDLPVLQEDPMTPHHAATLARQEAQARHIPYDFKMDFYDSTAMFCSEVGSYAYRKNDIQLWRSVSTISSEGIVQWLNAFGVEHFVTQMPSDLEYDPQLAIVAEWRDPQLLLKDHIDNAVMDALLENANRGARIGYNHFMLPIARLVKAYSMIENAMGKPGIIPEGMSATRALKNNWFVACYAATKKRTQIKIDAFIKEQGYTPPYWEMLRMARESVELL